LKGCTIKNIKIKGYGMKFHQPEWHDRLPSTNSTLLERLSSGQNIPTGSVIAAHTQTAGRGRYNRRWLAEAGQNLTFSFLYTTKASGTQLASLPMAIALGICDAMKTFNITTQVKWPNDILIDGAKLSGMLLERSDAKHPNGTPVVVGIGLNVNMTGQAAAHIDRPATSMHIETGREYDVKNVLTQILTTLPPWLNKWEHGGFDSIQTDWTDRCAYIGEHIRVGEGKNIQTGILEGFGPHGQLLLKSPTGKVAEVWAGDVAAI
jgi:BirA family biotin operon repressor/biotin-[acetyl-CoA-carboxylase] ligase